MFLVLPKTSLIDSVLKIIWNLRSTKQSKKTLNQMKKIQFNRTLNILWKTLISQNVMTLRQRKIN